MPDDDWRLRMARLAQNQSQVAAPAVRAILDKIGLFGFDVMFLQIPRVFCLVLILFCFKLNDRT
jgi:hypothetical protein